MLTLSYARHGETIWYAENRYAGTSDIPLTDHGRKEAAELAAWAADTGFDRVVASSLSRAVDTARPTADALGLRLEIDRRFREVGFGSAEGLTQDETERTLPEARAAYVRTPATSPFPGGEVGAAAAARAVEAVWELAQTSPGGRVLVVAHSAVGRLLFSSLLGIPLNEYRRVFPWLAGTAITTLRLPTGTATPADLSGTAQLLEFNRPV
ncbi:histidine phosphatase family protein [Lysobacter korlensis]|uniref:Histidine phosphatase family protein n=1 Tax=Lysobacter korlensis TaxID=553636 RepID=A0ABV6S098_9GAMM